jgi:hypothetical protein
MLSVVLAFMIHSRRRRLHFKSWFRRNGPVLLVALSIPLILADTVRHVLLDQGLWPGCIALPDGACAWYSATMYNGEADTVADENLTHLSLIGVLFTIVFTYSGFLLLAAGTLYNADIVKKLAAIRDKWTRLRAQALARTSAADTAGAPYVEVSSA